MSGSFAAIVVAMSLIAIAVVLAPLRGKQKQVAATKRGPEPASEYQATLIALRDLDFDHGLGVVAEDDYQRLREELIAQAAQTMPQEKPGGRKPKKSRPGGEKKSARGKQIPTGSEQVVASPADENACPECARPHQPEHVFCGGCGARLPAA